jgi:N-acetylneuraminic acid mutarotase
MHSAISRRELVCGGLTAAVAMAVKKNASAQSVQTPWTNIAPMPVESGEVLGATAIGKFYVMAGLAPGFVPRRLVLEYDPVSDRWSRKKPIAFAAHHIAFSTLGDKIYAFGGFSLPASGPAAWVPTDNAWEYEPATDSWKQLAPMPTRRGAASAAAINGKIYVVGGTALSPGITALNPHSAQAVLSTVEEYDPANNTWRVCAPMPTPRNHLVVAAVEKTIYAIGGRIGSVFIPASNNLDLVEPYDPVADRWGAPLERMPTARSGMAWGVHGAHIYVAGGEFQSRGLFETFNAVEAFDTSAGRWIAIPPMANPRHGAAGGVIGDRFFVSGGEVQSGGNGVRAEMALGQALHIDQLNL